MKFKLFLPEWADDWLGVLVPSVQLLAILLAAWLLQLLLRRLMQRVGEHYELPHKFVASMRGLLRWTILGSATLLALERLGVSATVLWTGFTGFMAVAAVAFFAAWSVLSNLSCALLIFTMQPFKLGDSIELIDSGDKPGLKGRVSDINMLYTTLEDLDPANPGALLQVPNSLFFQKAVRRWSPSAAPA